MAGIAPRLPLNRDDKDGFYALTKDFKENSKQNFKNLILTSPGERIMDPNFGVGIRNFLFENISQDAFSDAIARIHTQVEEYMPFISIIDVAFISPDVESGVGLDANGVQLIIEYEVTPIEEKDSLEIIV